MIKLKKEKYGKIISDRCPYDVCAYVNDQEKQHSMIEEYMHELDTIFRIKVKTIYLRVPFSMAKRRVGDRLAREPWRKNYHEDEDEFLKKTWSYYENHRLDWDYIVDNEESIEKGHKQLIKIVGRHRTSARI